MYALIEYKPPPGPWNKGKIVGPKPPLRPQEVWSIRIHLQMKAKGRDLAMFNLAIDSKLRGCDLVRLLLGHASMESTIRYLRIEVDDALELSEQTEV
jgi:hypothetical protein